MNNMRSEYELRKKFNPEIGISGELLENYKIAVALRNYYFGQYWQIRNVRLALIGEEEGIRNIGYDRLQYADYVKSERRRKEGD